jgi:hypothetical protein
MNRRRLLALPAALLALSPGLALANSGGGEKKGAPVSTYIPIRVLTATIQRPTGGRGVMTLECGVDVPDPKLREFVDKSTPRLRAAYFQILQTYASGTSGGGLPNADFLAKELQRETDRMVGRPGARFLMGSLMIN